MSLRLHETTVSCGKCGMSLWRVTRFIYDFGSGTNVTIEEDPVCRLCAPRRYYEILKHAERVESLVGTGQTQQTKQGKVEEMKEQGIRPSNPIAHDADINEE